MQFDCDGNLFIYEPGAGCLGVPCKIPQGFTQEEMENISSSDNKDGQPLSGSEWNKFPKIDTRIVHRITPKVPVNSVSVQNGRR